MEEYKRKVVFVVLVYGNYNDLTKFVESIPLRKEEYFLIVVNSYKDSNSLNVGKTICKELGATFVEVANNGYGAGNNAGLAYALKKLDFDYVFISNPDIEIKNINFNNISEDIVMGPKVITNTGKNQNPYYFRKEVLGFKLLKSFAQNGNLKLYYMYLVNNKISKSVNKFVYSLYFDNQKAVYALHGSFFGMTRKTLKKMMPIFDEKMFLYSEEDHLAELARYKGIRMIYNEKWMVLHHEDGSGVSNKKVTLDRIASSLRVFFKNWDQ
jgi:GT2 family glycosyltransferase